MPAVWQNSWIIVQWLIKAKSIPVPPVLSLHCSSPTVPSAQRGAMRRRRRRRRMMRTVMFARGLEKRLPLIFVQRTKPRRLSGTIWKMCFHSAYSKYNCSFFFFFFSPKRRKPNFKKKMRFVPVAMATGQHSGQEDSRGGWGQSSHLSSLLLWRRRRCTVYNYTERQFGY